MPAGHAEQLAITISRFARSHWGEEAVFARGTHAHDGSSDAEVAAASGGLEHVARVRVGACRRGEEGERAHHGCGFSGEWRLQTLWVSAVRPTTSGHALRSEAFCMRTDALRSQVSVMGFKKVYIFPLPLVLPHHAHCVGRGAGQSE